MNALNGTEVLLNQISSNEKYIIIFANPSASIAFCGCQVIFCAFWI